MIKFRTWYDARIDEVEVLRETAKYVIIQEKRTYSEDTFERRDAKRSENGMCYHDTWTAAKNFLIDREKTAIICLLAKVKEHEETLRKIKEMSQP